MTEKPPTNVAMGSETAVVALATSKTPDGRDAPKQMSAMEAYMVSIQLLQRK